MAAKAIMKHIWDFCMDSDVDDLLIRVIQDVAELETDEEKKEWLLELKGCARRPLCVYAVWATASPGLKPFLRAEFPSNELRAFDERAIPTLDVSWDCRCEEGEDIGRYDTCCNCGDTYEANMADLIDHPRDNYICVNDIMCISNETIADMVENFVGQSILVSHCTCTDRECSCDLSEHFHKVQVFGQAGPYAHNLPLAAFGKRNITLEFRIV